MKQLTRYNPRMRYDRIRAKEVPSTDEERSLFVLMHGEKVLNKLLPLQPWKPGTVLLPEVEYAYNVVFPDEILRSTLEAFLLSTSENNQIANALGMSIEEIYTYRALFFDTSVFRNDLEVIAFLRSIPDSAETKELYRLAYNQGFNALRWYFCRNKGMASADEVIQTIMLDAYHNALASRGLPVNSKTTKEALKHATLALQCARTLRAETITTHDEESLEFKFKEVGGNKTYQDLVSEGKEILH